ncbi:undecaprenyl-phosphate glucose phosphotransferase [Pseudoflavonifractor sp. 524-17]|uniref:undecaprenyl-phosphate glucose phosphotransferase n=1 Tax=Pseudoflavonifractor sp. 524-17 TaxID=2304577 RepID=UPI00137B3055|nr:undecaprenyl-phosphate glucose phosphotransferase [Pseudoflavonifractor sp. 524-17]NCE66449.1 undecaprenyl-phosphate glucose phosphotransferase [Pseudoflavonifractor sp. 524-17]
MIRENQRLLNRLNVLSDGALIYLMLPLAYWLRFYVMPDGIAGVPLSGYLRIGIAIALVQLFTYAAFGLYQSSRKTRIRDEVSKLLKADLLDMLLLLGWLFVGHRTHYSRWTLALFFFLSFGTLSLKRVAVRRMLWAIRRSGRNQKRVLVIGSGQAAGNYLAAIQADRELGYQAVGYIAKKAASGFAAPYLGGYEALEKVLERTQPDEVISAIEMSDYGLTPRMIACCEGAGVKLSIIPFYADYMPAHPQFDDLNGIPLMNIRRIPLDNFANAFVKRAMDIAGALLMLILGSPLLLVSAIGVKLSSPGPVLFRQVRVGRNRRRFALLKLRTMEMNPQEDSAWSRKEDSRRTHFGSILRKLSIDELPQALNVLRGDMSLVGPRPELPKFVDQFKEEIPLYMVRHQVRPGITGWAQINGFRGDTPIKARVEHDIYYIENWSVWLDIKILLATVFRGKFVNDETLN